MKRIFALAWSCLLGGTLTASEVVEADICVYGGTAAGVAAAVQAAKMGKRAVITEFGKHLGGMTSGGLGATDIGNKAAIGGLALDFYRRVARHYLRDEAWVFETREDYFRSRSSRSTLADVSAPNAAMWTFEPKVAESIFFQMANESKVEIYFEQRLASVKKTGPRITEIAMENGKVYRAKMFIDATYEGDLMAKAGVRYIVGREANSEHNETLNGIRAETPKHQFVVNVDPYIKPGDAKSGLLPFVQPDEPGQPGSGDLAVQAYNFRLCYTKTPANRLPHIAPPNYDPARYELLARYVEAMVAGGRKPTLDQFWHPLWMPNGKTDINNNGGFSTDFIGANYAYPDGDYATRQKIWKEHEEYIRGFVYFLATSPRLPQHLRDEMNAWGAARDEFLGTGSWPHQLYVREARRMISNLVMTEHHCRGRDKVEDPVALAAYTMDSHNCRRIVRNGRAENEGDVQVGGFPPYPISYRSIIPKAAECENLAVPVCLSATHIAYGSIRMEPVFMILAQSAATAAALAIDGRDSLQEVSYEKLRRRLVADEQILEWKTPARTQSAASLKGILLDDLEGKRSGNWTDSQNQNWARLGTGYIHDGNSNKGRTSISFHPTIPRKGKYEIFLVYPPHENRATKVPVSVSVGLSGGERADEQTRFVNQREASRGHFASLGTFSLPKGEVTTITISTGGTDGYVVVDGVQLVPTD